MFRFFIAILAGAALFISSPLSLSAQDLTRKQKRLANEISSVFVTKGIITQEMANFLGVEAQKAGVRKIRGMKPNEKPKITKKAQTGCGVALSQSKLLLIDTDRKICVNLHNLVHEIAHFFAYRRGCFGHGDRFYRFNYELAVRFETAFPGKWNGIKPAKAVLIRASEYRSFSERCVGGKPFP